MEVVLVTIFICVRLFFGPFPLLELLVLGPVAVGVVVVVVVVVMVVP